MLKHYSPKLIYRQIIEYKDFPKKGVTFFDISRVLENVKSLKVVQIKMSSKFRNHDITKIVGIESRGFIFSALLSSYMKISLIMARKKGKLPGEVISEELYKEYGSDCLEMQVNSINSRDRVLIVDDVLATGGTSLATANLVEKLGGKVMGFTFLIAIPKLRGLEKLTHKYDDIYYMIEK